MPEIVIVHGVNLDSLSAYSLNETVAHLNASMAFRLVCRDVRELVPK